MRDPNADPTAILINAAARICIEGPPQSQLVASPAGPAWITFYPRVEAKTTPCHRYQAEGAANGDAA